MAINQVAYKGDIIIDLTNDTVTPETLKAGFTAHAKNGEMITGTMSGSEAELGELTITKNGEYIANVYGAHETVTKVLNSTIPFAINVEGMGFWKVSDDAPTDLEVFKDTAFLKAVASYEGESQEMEMSLRDVEWYTQDGVVAMAQQACLYIIYNPDVFEEMMGVQVGFEQGIYFMDAFPDMGAEYTLTFSSITPCDGYSKVVVDVPNGGLDWRKVDSNTQYSLMNGDLLIKSTGEILRVSDWIGAEEFMDSIERVFIMNGATGIDQSAFQECPNLHTIIIPDSVTSIGSNALGQSGGGVNNTAYYNDDSNWVDNVLYAGKHFIRKRGDRYSSGQHNAETYDIKQGTLTIADGAFSECTHLTSVYIPSSVTNIGERAFNYCSWLTSIDIPDGVTEIKDYTFSSCFELKTISIPDSVTDFGQGAFYQCIALREITIPEGMTSIKDSLFSGCGQLTSITIPDSVTSIGGYAFSECTGLTSIDIPNDVTSIGHNAFDGCTHLTSINIPNGVTSVGLRTFRDCTSLTSITIPDSITSIDWNAFENCTSLVSINYTGTIAQWNAITFDSDWNKNTGNYTIHCTDGDIAKS